MNALATLQPGLKSADADAAVPAGARPPLRLEADVLEAAMHRAREIRAQTFRDTIGALWRFGSCPRTQAGIGRSCGAA